MAAAPPLQKPDGTRVPLQARAKKTYEKILSATQDLLQESGLEALNTNAVAERAGVTTPLVYRYFKDKYALLKVLGERLTGAQNDVYLVGDEAAVSLEGYDALHAVIYDVLKHTYKVTAEFTGAVALLTSLRAVPELTSVRLDTNREMAELTARRIMVIRPDLNERDAYERSRLAVEVGYSAIEMLLEVPSIRPSNVLYVTASAITDIYLGKTKPKSG